MTANEEKKQWLLCPFCASPKAHGRDAEALVRSMVAEGTPQEEAEMFVRRHASGTYECPTPEKHSKGMVPFGELEDGGYYYGKCRNATIARWNAGTQRFIYMREKFGRVYPEEIGYWSEAHSGEHRFDEFKPHGKLSEAPFYIPKVSW